MKAKPASPESKDRPAPARRRASRSFAPTSPALEGRDLLSTVDLDSLSSTAAVAVGSVSVTTTALPPPPDPSGTSAGVGGPPPSDVVVVGDPPTGSIASNPGSVLPVAAASVTVTTTALPLPPDPSGTSAGAGSPPASGVVGNPPTGGIATGPGPVLPVPPGPQPSSGASRTLHQLSKFRLGLAEADVLVDGQHTPEFALSVPSRGVVLVKVGLQGPVTVLTADDGINNPGQVVLKDVNGDGLPDLLVANTGGNSVLVFPGLPNGGVGPELNGGSGFAVGQQPTGITVSDLKSDGSCEVIVANWGSANVTVLAGQGRATNFALVPVQTLKTGISPVRTLVQDINHDGKPDLFVLNSGSNNVTMY
jgi:hypothetical protein